MENQSPRTPKVLGYVRVSTEDQADHGVSLAAQRAKVEAYARAHGLDLIDVIADSGASAKSLERPGLQWALVMLRERKVDGLVLAKLDRLTRSVRDWAELVEEFFGRLEGPRLYSASEDLNLKSASGRMVSFILMAVAQAERETIVERTQGAMDHKAARGEQLGTIPFGKRLGPDGKTLEPDLAEEEALAAMTCLFQAGLTLRAIAANLDQRGFPTRTGRPWSHSTVAKLLARPLPTAEEGR